MESAQFSLPSVTVQNFKRRKGRRNERRCCSSACFLRLLILIFPFLFYKQIAEILALAPAQTDISAPAIRRDYSAVKSFHDLSYELVRPKCFRGVRDCPCLNPMNPIEGDDGKWKTVFTHNKEIVRSQRAGNADVVFLGDSITEGWRGTWYGQTETRTEGNLEVFDSLFMTENGGAFDGIALGIAGDKSPNLLWRLQNGELAESLSPKVFWILIGTNDIGNTWCSPELVVVGVLRAVEEILLHKPTSQVVINAILPRSFHKEGYVARGGQFKPSVWRDIQAINGELKTYATYRKRVVFFETKVFFNNPLAPTPELQLDKMLMPDFLHPSAKGYQLWGEEIVLKLQKIVPKR